MVLPDGRTSPQGYLESLIASLKRFSAHIASRKREKPGADQVFQMRVCGPYGDTQALESGKKHMTLNVDRQGNGRIDRTIDASDTLTSEDYNKEATPEEIKASHVKSAEAKSPNTKNNSEEGLPYTPKKTILDHPRQGTIPDYEYYQSLKHE